MRPAVPNEREHVELGTWAAWAEPQPHDAARSLRVVRVVVGAFLFIHPLFTFSHPEALQAAIDEVQRRGLPAASALTWVALLVLGVGSLALIAGRWLVPACLALLVVLAAGALALYAPHWFVAGGGVDGDHLGVEYNVLLVVCLLPLLWAAWRPEATTRSIGLLRVLVGLVLLPHPLHPFVLWDVEGMRGFGEFVSQAGWPMGVPLVWTVVTLQGLCCLALVAGRFVVPACLGLMGVLGTGTVMVHYPAWFIVGPGRDGMEFPLTYLTVYLSLLLAYWPSERGTAGLGSQPAGASGER